MSATSMIAISLIIYGFAFLSALTLLTVMSSISVIQNRFFRVIAGGSTGSLSASYLTGVKPMLSFLEASVNGDFGISGYAMLASAILMLFIWGYNLIKFNGVVA